MLNGRPGNRRLILLIGILLAVAVAVVYRPVHRFDFVNFDDRLYALDNPRVQEGMTLKNIVWAFTGATEVSNYWAPVTWLSFLVDSELYALWPGGYHLTNLLLHLANTLLLFWFLQRATGSIRRSALVSGLFALHPLHVESVAWITERKDVLSTFFWLSTMSAYLRYVERPGVARYLLVCLCFLLGIMAKPMLVTLPFVLLLLDYWPLGRLQPVAAAQPPVFRRLLWEKLPFLLVAAVISAATYLTQKEAGAVGDPIVFPLTVRLENGLVAYMGYLGRTFLPLGLSVIYPHPGDLPNWQGAASLVLLGAATVWTVRHGRRHPWLPVGWLWFLGTLVPVIGVVVIGPHAMADRYTYVPLIGLFIVLVWGGAALPIPGLSGAGRLAFGLVILLLLAGISRRQVDYWQDSITLFRRALSVTGENWVAHNNLGTALLEKGENREATHHFRAAVRIYPGYAEAYNNLGVAAQERGEYEEAVAHYSEALRLAPDYAGAHNNLGNALQEQGRLQAAVSHFRAALRLRPDFPQAHLNLGVALLNRGDIEGAKRRFATALRYKPNLVAARHYLGVAEERLGRVPQALAHYRAALQYDPGYAEAWHSMGIAYEQLAEPGRALECYRRALAVAPEHYGARFHLANRLAVQGESSEALRHYRELLKYAPEAAEVYNQLGVVHAGREEWAEAITAFRKAVSLDPAMEGARRNLERALQRPNPNQ